MCKKMYNECHSLYRLLSNTFSPYYIKMQLHAISYLHSLILMLNAFPNTHCQGNKS